MTDGETREPVVPVRFGVAGLAIALGEEKDVGATATDYVDDPERILRWGYRSFHEASEDVTSTDLAADAAVRAMHDAHVDADQLDMIVLADSDIPEYLHWDPSAALARALGVRQTPTLLLTQACASGVTGFGNIAGAMAIRPDVDVVLFVAVNRVSAAYRNRMTTSTCLGSDGAAAAVLRRDHDRLRWMSTEQLTDPEYCDFYRAEYGGSRSPIAPAGRANTDITVMMRVQEHFDRDPALVKGFIEELGARVATVVKRACQRAGVPMDQLSRLVYINDNKHSLREVAGAVGIPVEKTNIELASRYGHLGCADQLVCLHGHLERNELASGDLVALTGVSGGMHWFCTLLRV